MVHRNGLFIFRRDFRLHDNRTLCKALQECSSVYCIFIFSKTQTTSNSLFNLHSFQFMLDSLHYLQQLCDGNLSLWYTDNEPLLVSRLISSNNIDTVYFNRDLTRYAMTRDTLIVDICKKMDIKCVSLEDYTLWDIGSVTNGKGTPYKVFTPFFNSCKSKRVSVLDYCSKLKLTLSKGSTNSTSVTGSTTLQKIAKKFKCNTPLDSVSFKQNLDALVTSLSDNSFNDYTKMRDFLHYNTTGLAVYLKYGLLSCRYAYQIVNNRDIKRQLIWREFYYHLFNNDYDYDYTTHIYSIADKYKWKIPFKNSNSNTQIRNWKNGNTGDLLVDSLMKELKQYGTMHNRGRMIGVSANFTSLSIYSITIRS